MTVCISVFSRWALVVFHCFGMGHRLRGLRRLRLSCRVTVSGPIGAGSGGLRRLSAAVLPARQGIQDGDEQDFVRTGRCEGNADPGPRFHDPCPDLRETTLACLKVGSL